MAHEAHEIKLPHICSVPLRTGGKEGTHSRTFTKVRHSFWPRLIATYALGWVGEPMHTFIFFFEGPKGRYGPREAWAHMGWVGHPAH